MDYEHHYRKLVERAKNRTLESYTEKHHIIPTCMDGPDVSENIISLTAEEHYVAHQLLVKMHPEHNGLVYAAYLMTVGHDERKGNKWYGWLKRRYHKVCRQRVGDKNGSFGRGWYYDPKSGESGKFLPDSVPVGWLKGRVCKAGMKKPTPERLDYCRDCGTDIKKVLGRYRKLCGVCLSKNRTKNVERLVSINRKVTNGEKKTAVEQSKNIRQALILLGLAPKGNNYASLRTLIKKCGWQLGKNLVL